MTLTRPASACARSRHGGMVNELFADGVEVTEHRDFAQGRRPASLQAGTIVSGSEHFHAGRLLAQPFAAAERTPGFSAAVLRALRSRVRR